MPHTDNLHGAPKIMTIAQLAERLGMTRNQIYSMTSARGKARMKHPLPCIYVNSNIRFLRHDVEK